MIDQALGRQSIPAALSAGDMGEVWRATDEKLGREVALKVLPAEMAANPERLERFQREARTLAALEEADALDPRSALVRGDLGWWLFGARDYQRAIEEATSAIELDPSFPEAHWLLAASYAQLGRFAEAMAEFERYESLYGEPVLWFGGYLEALAGRREEALRDLDELERSGAPEVELAQVHLGLGDHERVIECLERADSPGVAFQPYLWPEYEPYHRDPRFLQILARLSLPPPPARSPQ